MKVYPLFNFDVDKIKEYCYEKISSNRERITYLNYVKKEHKNRCDRKDILTVKFFVGSLPRIIDNEIEFIKGEMELDTEIPKEQTTAPEREKKMEKLAESNIKKIRWQGTVAQLVFLIDQLFDSGFLLDIDRNEVDRMINSHFEDRFGKPYKKDVIKATRDRIKTVNKDEMPKGGKKILEIIKETENITE